jgi:hypothetical protein
MARLRGYQRPPRGGRGRGRRACERNPLNGRRPCAANGRHTPLITCLLLASGSSTPAPTYASSPSRLARSYTSLCVPVLVKGIDATVSVLVLSATPLSISKVTPETSPSALRTPPKWSSATKYSRTHHLLRSGDSIHVFTNPSPSRYPVIDRLPHTMYLGLS